MESLTHVFSFEDLPDDAFANVLSRLSLQEILSVEHATQIKRKLLLTRERQAKIGLIKALAANKKGWRYRVPCLSIVNTLYEIGMYLKDFAKVEEAVRAVGKEPTSFSPCISFQVEETVTMTARSLLLNKDARVPVFGSGALDNNDVYVTRLDLSTGLLAKWASQKLRILDLGCGMSHFPAEASTLYGLRVDGIDRDPCSQHRARAAEDYVLNIARLYLDLLCNETKTTIRTREDCRPLAKLLFESSVLTAYNYCASEVIAGDAKNLAKVPDGTYDVVLSCWLFMYLKKDEQEKAFRELVRVTKLHGSVRIFSGKTLGTRYKFSRKDVLSWAKYEGKRAEIIEFELDEYLEFRVEEETTCIVS
jgi:SAM-dependent methyltransferase